MPRSISSQTCRFPWKSAGALATAMGALIAAGTGCNPGDFSDLGDQVWVDARDPFGKKATDKNVLIGYSPRNDLGPTSPTGDVPQLMVVGDSPAVMFHLDVKNGGAVSKERLEIEESTARALSGAPLLVARNSSDGLVVGAMRDRSNDAYLLFGDLGEGSDNHDFVTSPYPFESLSKTDTESPLDWQALAVAGVHHLTVAAVGPLIREPDGPLFLEANATGLGRSADTAPARCRIDSEAEGGDTYQATTAFAILSNPLDDSDNPSDLAKVAETRFVVGTDSGVRVVGFAPPCDADDAGCMEAEDVCQTDGIQLGAPVDGSFEIGQYVGEDELPDVFGAVVGQSIVMLIDVHTDVRPETASAVLTLSAPSGASASWGRSFAVGDFDDDGAAEVAVGDPGQGLVDLYDIDVDAMSVDRVKTVEPVHPLDGFGKAVASVPFGDGEKDLLVVGSDDKVLTYFRIFPDDESTTDRDPRQ